MMLNSLDLEGCPQDTRVVVAMSGGVDSSVTAALLKAEGYDVVGVTLQLYDHGAATHRKGACCAGQDIHDARAVAERIGIPHYVLDYESRFKEAVIDRFADELSRGRDAGAVRRVQPVDQVPRSARRPRASSAPRCWRPATTSPRARCRTAAARSIARAMPSATRAISCSPPRASSSTCCAFRSASATKAETRELARQFGLAVADKHDSQDICFVPTGRYTDVIERLRPGAAEPGDIVDLDGRVLGRHDGIIHFTVGQRRGLGVAAGHPLYVVRLDAGDAARRGRPARGAAHEPHARCATSTGSARARSTMRCAPAGTRCSSRCARRGRRSRPGSAAARGGIEVDLVAGEDGVSPGQACVFYDAPEGQARVLGGGIIQSAVAAAEAGAATQSASAARGSRQVAG